jgi:hypothetical protein
MQSYVNRAVMQPVLLHSRRRVPRFHGRLFTPGSIMNISGTSNSIASLSALQGLQPQQVGSSADADDGSTPRPHKMHGGGHMRQAVGQALQSLGLTPPSGTSSAGSASSTDAGGSDSSGAASSVQQDMQQFMHSLFEAVKGESASSTSASSSSSASDPKTSFADGLSSLISQVSSGSAPSDLQSAFSKLAADLQAAGTTTSSSAASSSGGSGSIQATLQAFLTNLQQDLGYGSSNASAIGNLMTAQV